MNKVIWFYGLSASGKTTEALKLKYKLIKQGKIVEHLDGDRFRMEWGNDLGFTREDRITNIKRACAVAKDLSSSGLTVIASFTTPFKIMREHLQSVLGDRLELIFVDTPLEECIRRDPKGLYKKALVGEIKNMIGVDIPFEV